MMIIEYFVVSVIHCSLWNSYFIYFTTSNLLPNLSNDSYVYQNYVSNANWDNSEAYWKSVILTFLVRVSRSRTLYPKLLLSAV